MLAKIELVKDKLFYQTGLLATTCGLAAILLVMTEVTTRPIIELRVAEDQNALLNEVLNGISFSNEVFNQGHDIEFEGAVYQVFPVRDAKDVLISHVIKGVQDGYSGEIVFLVGVNMADEITGVRIISHTETPGLGDKIELAKSPWVLSFNQHSIANTPLWAVKKDGGEFDQFSGATITPRSVVRGVHQAMLALAKDKEAGNESSISSK
ncbi:RnfABCDGE type electron transport complex subunit G [Vibrio sp. RC27]